MRSLVLSLCVLVGCGSNPPTASPDAPPVDAAVDSPVDSPSTSGVLVMNDGTGTISQWNVPSTFVGTSSSARMFVVNLGTIGTENLTPILTGPDAAKFSITGTTCTQLVAGNICSVDVRFSPTGAGAANAMLQISDGTQNIALPLIGAALVPSGTGLEADLAVVNFNTITRDDVTSAQLLLSNTSTSTISLGARTAAAPFGIINDNCPATLTPGGACSVTLKFDGIAFGNATGTFHAASSANNLDVPLQGVVLRKLSVTFSGFGVGSVTSMPVGIDCPATLCSAGFPGGVPVVFTATAAASNMFIEFGDRCSGTSCSVASPLDGTVSARFVPAGAKKVTITMAGSSRGYAGVQLTSGITSYGRCMSSCVVYVPPAAEITVYGYSPSTFVGWTGDCTASTDACNLGTVVADRSVTLTTAADPSEVATLLPGAAITGLAISPTGNLVVATNQGVSEITLAGATVWSTAISGGATSLATDNAGRIYGLGGPGVFALSAAGAIMWTRTFSGAPVRMYSLHGSLATSPDGTVIAVLTSDGVHVVDGTGVDRFTITGVSPAPQTAAVAPDGTVGLIQIDQSMASGQTKALRYTNDGSPLPTFPLLPGHTNTSLTFDITNAVCGISTGGGHSTVFRATAPGVLAFSSDQIFSNSLGINAGVVTTSGGQVVGIRHFSSTQAQVPGVRFDVFSLTGTTLLTHNKPPTIAFSSQYLDGVIVQRIAAGGTNRIALAGMYAYSFPWIQVYDVP